MKCSVCHSTDLSLFFQTQNIPVHIGILWETTTEATACEKGDIELVFCNECGSIANVAFDPAIMQYEGDYDNSLHCSPLYQKYSKAIADRLVETYQILDKNIVEIGAGRGEFLSIMCDAGNNRGVGFDPSLQEKTPPPENPSVRLVKDFYSPHHAGVKADMICSRNVFEHIADPLEFLQMVRAAVGERKDTIIFFEVPNVNYLLEAFSYWDIIYEHCSYFGQSSLERVFRECRFKPIYIEQTYENQFLCIDARPCESTEAASLIDAGTLEHLKKLVLAVQDSYTRKIADWRGHLQRFQKEGRKTVLWGAGARGTSFLNMVGVDDEIEFVVDINSRKKGRFVPGTGQEIITPDLLIEYRPDYVILTNPIYKNEVARSLQEMELNTEIMCA